MSKEASRYIRRWLERQPQVNEESLTDWFLDWTAYHCREIRYTIFNHHQEAKITGADWEWWILGDAGAFKLRVQAKKVKEVEDNYPDLARANKHGLQIEKLIGDAQVANAVPIYAFYAAGGGTCNSGSGCGNSLGAFSVFVAEADRVQASFIQPGRKFVGKGDVLNISTSLHCVFCCDAFGPAPNRGLGAFAQFIRFHDQLASVEMLFQRAHGFHRQVPPTIAAFAELPESEDRARWAAENAPEFQDVDALAVLDLRRRADSEE